MNHTLRSLAVTSICLALVSTLHAQWKQLPGLYGGNITQIVSIEDTVFVRGDNGGGIFRSTNAGASWESVTYGLGSGVVRSMVVSGSRLLAATPVGLYLSDDRGRTWVRNGSAVRSNGMTVSEDLTSISSLASAGSIVYGLSFSGSFFRSTDRGNNWTAPAGRFSPSPAFTVAAIGTTVLWYARDQIWMSMDTGNTFKPWPPARALAYPFSFFVDGTTVYAFGTNEDGRSFSILRSLDAGQTWNDLAVPNGPTSATAFVANGDDILLGTEYGCFRSTDGGSTWLDVPQSRLIPNVLNRQGSMLWAGDQRSAVLRSTDGGLTWAERNVGIGLSQVKRMAICRSALFVAASDRSPVRRTFDLGQHWVTVGDSTYAGANGFHVEDSVLYVVGNTSIGRTTDLGENWTTINSPGSVEVLTRLGSRWYIGEGYTTSYSSDGGVVWSPRFPDIGGMKTEFVSRGGRLWVGASDGLHYSTDGGNEWPFADSLPKQPVTSLSQTDGALFATTSDAAVRSTDEGRSWQTITFAPPFQEYYSILPVGNAIVLAGGSSVYVSYDGGSSFERVSEGLLDAEVIQLTTDGMRLFAATAGAGIWYRDLSELGIAAVPKHADRAADPSRISVVPNPIATLGMITFGLPESGQIRIELVDVLGRTVQQVFQGSLEAGVHEIPLDLSALRDGTYQCVLSAGNSQSSAAVIVSK